MACKKTTFDPAHDIPPLDGKVILVTGGNIGLGKQSILEFARHNPAQIWLAARNLDKAKTAVEEIQSQLTIPVTIKLLELDLSSLESVKKAAQQFVAESDRLDILMLNAGIMAAPPGLTKDGYELQFGTNHMGHALFTKLLLPVLSQTANNPYTDVRIVALSSDAHTGAPKGGIAFETLRTDASALGSMERYGQSKTANILWAKQMAKLYPQFTFASIHPGIVQTNLQSGATGGGWVLKTALNVGRSFMAPVEKGVRNQLWAAVSKDVVSGEYYQPIGVSGKGSDAAKDDQLAKKLWEWTEKELAAHSW